jgi:hypothetical protein
MAYSLDDFANPGGMTQGEYLDALRKYDWERRHARRERWHLTFWLSVCVILFGCRNCIGQPQRSMA